MAKKEKLIINSFHEIQDKNGFISEQDIKNVATEFHKSDAEIYEAISSYANFNLFKSKKRIVKICDSPSCHIKNGEKLIKKASEILNVKVGNEHGKVIIEACQCLSLCDKGPIMMIDNKIYTKVSEEKLEQIFKKEGLV
ncbi:MAG: NAD(P)H-dependent oxidoreductase subunit E [Patescibacteria group bacterium]|nr:NAD(P)H-dependent oxidoreductase subunit E [Patescibacteria group bacterium]MDD4304285.1 NAD(P)H-dependent oxidoreductase subunit E [Patescibacteria group bacterium]MDD4695688.1 NAD(P)H-dependent oxidoreductase subunit E [Patescibacteria group bacterium]